MIIRHVLLGTRRALNTQSMTKTSTLEAIQVLLSFWDRDRRSLLQGTILRFCTSQVMSVALPEIAICH